jgi:heme oxygenase-like protein
MPIDVGRPGASRALRQKIALAHEPTDEIYRRVWAHTDLAEFFPQLLLRTHDIARASVSLMETALARCHGLATGDAVAAGMLDYLRQHIEEERDHDVWILEDLEALGLPREEALARLPSPTAASLVGAQYYWIHYGHPVALLGYMAALESNVPSERFIEDLIERTALPRAGFRTLLLHAHVDPHHATDLDRLVDSLPLSRLQLATIGVSALQTVSLLARLTEEVVSAHTGRTNQSGPEAA